MKILIASHGTFASGIKSVLDILLGEKDHMTVIDTYLDLAELEAQLDAYFQAIPQNEQVVMLSDLYGGRVNQAMYMYLKRPDTFLVAGMNLTLVMQLVLQTEPLNSEMLKEIVEESKDALRVVEFESNMPEELFWD